MNAELKLQSECHQWLWNNYPHTRNFAFAIKNEDTSVKRRLIGKAIGVIPGIPDYCLVWQGRVSFIEFKSEAGKLSENQKAIHNLYEQNGTDIYIVRNIIEFTNVCKMFFKID